MYFWSTASLGPGFNIPGPGAFGGGQEGGWGAANNAFFPQSQFGTGAFSFGQGFPPYMAGWGAADPFNVTPSPSVSASNTSQGKE